MIVIFSAFGCGKEVSVPHPMESQTSITLSEPKNVTESGTILKNDSVVLVFNEKNYSISKYSSKMALDFIDELPLGESSVKFTGEIRDHEIVVVKFN